MWDEKREEIFLSIIWGTSRTKLSFSVDFWHEARIRPFEPPSDFHHRSLFLCTVSSVAIWVSSGSLLYLFSHYRLLFLITLSVYVFCVQIVCYASKNQHDSNPKTKRKLHNQLKVNYPLLLNRLTYPPPPRVSWNFCRFVCQLNFPTSDPPWFLGHSNLDQLGCGLFLII